MNLQNTGKSLVHPRLVWLLGGVLAGVIGASLWPTDPLYAVATDRFEDFAVCTAPVDEEMEGIFFLDHLTGDLKGAVLSPRLRTFNATFTYNILADFGLEGRPEPPVSSRFGSGQVPRPHRPGKPREFGDLRDRADHRTGRRLRHSLVPRRTKREPSLRGVARAIGSGRFPRRSRPRTIATYPTRSSAEK